VNAKLTCELIEWQELVLSLMLHDRFSGTLQYRRGHDSPTAIPWAVGLERNRQECGELALPQADRATRFAKLVHRRPHDAIRWGGRKATSGLYGRRS
jgi:hypothetical protein